MPFSSTIFLICILKAFSLVWEYYYYSLGVLAILIIISLLNCKFTYRNQTPKWRTLTALIEFVMAIFWIWFVAKNLIEVLNLIGVLFDVPGFFLGMTLLSLGNSLPDLTLNSSLARAGFGKMGLAGSIAGPLFNLLIGLGSSLIKKTITTGSVKIELYKPSQIVNLFAIVILGLNLIRLLVQASCMRFSLGKCVSVIGYLFYFLFCVGITLLTFVFPDLFKF
jgi:Ca2+/Na+ antiporter